MKKGTRLTLTFTSKPIIAVYNKDVYDQLSARLKNEVDEDLAIQNSYKRDDPFRLADVCLIDKNFLIFDSDKYFIKGEYLKQLEQEAQQEEQKKQEEIRQEELKRQAEIASEDNTIYSPKDPEIKPATYNANLLYSRIRYPEAALQNGVQGIVMVRCIINKKGEVTETHIVKSADTDLDKEAKRVVRTTTFAPAEKNGKPVNSWLEIGIVFRVNNYL